MSDNTTGIEEKFKENNELRMNLRVYTKFWSFVIKRQSLLFIGYALFLIVMASLTPIFTFLWKKYIDKAVGGSNITTVILTLVLYIIIKVVLDFCYFLSMRFMDSINFSSWRVLDTAINKKATDIPDEYFEVPDIHSKINRAWEFNHGSYIELYQLEFDMINGFTQIIGIFISLYIINPLICAVALLTVISGIISKLIGDKVTILSNRQLSDSENELGYYRNAIYDQSLMKDIIMKNAFGFFEQKYRDKAHEMFDKKRAVEIKKLKLLLCEEIVRNLVIFTCFAFAAYQFIHGDTSMGGLAAVFTIIVNLVHTLSRLV